MICSADSKVGFINLSNLPNIKLPEMFAIIEVGSKINTCKVNAKKMVYAFGCVDGRCVINSF